MHNSDDWCRYKMRLVYAHFPINANAEKGGAELSIRNFLGEKIVRTIPMCEGVKVAKDVDVKDQLLFEGNSIENVSRCVLNVNQSHPSIHHVPSETPRAFSCSCVSFPLTITLCVADHVRWCTSHAWSSIRTSGNSLMVSTSKRRAQLSKSRCFVTPASIAE